MKKILLISLLVFVPSLASAYDALIDGIYYNLNYGTKEAEVTKGDNQYVGNIVIPSSVFYNESDFTVASIGASAFSGCSNIISVSMQEGVSTIGKNAFEECKELTSINIPSTVIEIGNDAFLWCESLDSVNITDLSSWCQIEFVNYRDSHYSSNPLGEAHHLFLNGEEVKDLVIPEDVTSVKDAAFIGCQSLESITLSNGVSSVGHFAFQGCDNVGSVFIASTVNYLGHRSFEECQNLSSVNISDLAAWCRIQFQCKYGYDFSYSCNPLVYARHLYLNGEEIGDLVIPDSLDYISEYSFYNCHSLKSVNIPGNVSYIGKEAFSGCSNIISVSMQEGLSTIGEGAFSDCTNLNSVYIPSSVKTIKLYAFSSCKNLDSVNITDLSSWCQIDFNYIRTSDNSHFFSCNPLRYAHHLYLNGEEVKDLVIPEDVTSICNVAFYGCEGIESVMLTNKVASIGHYAFSECSNMISVTMQEGLSYIHDGAFSGCTGLSSVVLPEGLKEIGTEAFTHCSGLSSVYFPTTIDYIWNNAFEECKNLVYVSISDLSAWCRIRFQNMPSYYGGHFSCNPLKYAHHLYVNGEEVKDLVVPEDVTTIDKLAFYGCQGLESVRINKNVTSIGSSAFSGCSNMTSVYVPSSVKSIGERAFYECEKLDSVNISDLAAWCRIRFSTKVSGSYSDYDDFTSNPLYWAHRLYLNGEEIRDLIIPNTVTSIGDIAFYNCRNLTSVEIPSSVTKIGERTFYGCDSLMTIFNEVENVFSIEYDTFSSTTYNTAILYVPNGTVELYQKKYAWNKFVNILVNKFFYVCNTYLTRETKRIHIKVELSNDIRKYDSLEGLVSLSSKEENLNLSTFSVSGRICDLYFELPQKEETYTLKIANSIRNANGDYLDQNLNAISKEEEDAYTENFIFGDNELYIVAQSPTTGVRDKAGYTDIVLSDVISKIPKSSVSMLSPSGNKIGISSVKYLDSPRPARHRISYSTLTEDGIYEITIAKGLKSDNETEMRYDQLVYIDVPRADLQPISVIPQDSQWLTGQKRIINYTVRNVGVDNANGPSVDVLYLSTSKEWDSEAIELYRDTTIIDLEPEKDLSRTIEVTVPPCTEGQYYLIMKTNVAHTLNELSYDDNTLVSDTISLSVDYLTDKNNKFTLARGESRLFKVLVDTDKNIEITDKYGITDIYMGCGGYPLTDENPANGIITMLGCPYFQLTYYLLVSNNGMDPNITQKCELNTREFELDITNVERTEIVKYKKAWIPIEMIGCTDMPIFYLVDDSGIKTECLNVYVKSETSFYAQFDTETLKAGNYNIIAECASKTGMLQNAVTIKQEVANPKLEAKLILPETSRGGSTITAYIDYKNVGNVDVPSPLFVITGPEGSEYAVDVYDDFSEEGHLYGMNEKSVLSAILPGESNRISMQIKIPNEEISNAIYKLKTITEGCDGMDEHFYLQWLDVDPDENPGCYTDEEWNDYCNRLRRNVGENWHTFIQSMATVTDLCFASDYVVHDATYLYDILKGYDLAEILAYMAEEKENRKNAPSRNEFVMPGTIYIYEDGLYNDSDKKDGDPWKRLVDPSGSSKWVKSSYCKEHPLNESAEYIFIAHGMNNTHKENWIKIMAYELYKKQKKNIICVDWGEWSYGLWGTTGIWPDRAASYIDTVVWRLNAALKVAFDEDIDLGKFHFIGHSHGAHVCGRLSNLYKGKSSLTRLTCLDMSEELDHMGSRGVNIYHPGDLRKRFNAEYIDYYKSSIICGTEWLVGDDNFILAMNDNYFVRPISSNGVPIDGKRHGYAYEWFSATINKENCEIGYQWDDKGNPRLSEMRERHGSLKRWSGVINGKGTLINKDMTVKNKNSIIENYSNFVNEGNWNYPEPWYNKGIFNPNKEKAREWDFFNAFASTIDYHPADIIMNKKYIQTGTKESLRVTVSNNADNLSIPLHDRQKETRDSVCNVLYISKDSTGYIKPECNRQISRLKCNKYPLYYLAESNNYVNPKEETSSSSMEFCFNVSRTIWELLGGNDRLDTINCCICVVTGVNKSNKDYKKRSNDSVELWKGELRPQDNCIWYPVTVRKPGLSCDAGADQTITLQKDQDIVDVNVAGTVVNEGDYELSYAWKEGNSEFSTTMEGTAPLGVGTHTLTFEVEANDASFAKARRAPSTSIDTIYDDVVIIVKPYTPGDEDDESTEILFSYDPNEKVGIRGAGGKSCIRQGETMEYTIYFENDAEKAQLAAQTVTVIDTLDTAFDLTTFEFTGAEAANTYIDVPLGKGEATILTDMRPDNDLILKTEMKLDIDKRIVKVVYSSLDTLTYEPTLDVFAGFLPPNDFTHRGEGHFSYRVRLKEDVADGYVVKNQAHIFFDYNDEIATNITHHPVDNRAPISTVDGLPNETREDSIMVSWSGYDQGAGIRYYDIYRSKNGGNFELWKSHTKDSYAYQYGVKNDIYKYFSIATDSLGFVEEMKTSPEATVKFIGSSDGITLVENDPKVDVIYQNEAFIVTGAEESMFNVYDLLGQIVLSKQLTSHYERIPFDRKGVYLVSVDNRVGVLFEKKLVTK